MVGLVGILLGLALLIAFAYRGWSVLLLAPAAALVAAGMSGEPLLAHWTNTFMTGTAGFVAQFFPIFLLGSLFGKLMEDSGSVSAIARFVGDYLGTRQATLAVVLVGAFVTYGGVNLMVAFFVIAPMAQALFQDANIPRRLMPAAIGLGTFTFTMSALPGSPAVQNAIPMPHFGTTPFAAPGLGIMAAVIMLGFGLWWLRRAENAARRTGEGFGLGSSSPIIAAEDEFVRETATHAGHFDPAELCHGHVSQENPTIAVAALPLVIVLCVNLIMSLLVLPRLDVAFLAEDKWGGVSLAEVAGVWSVVVALAAATVAVLLLNLRRLPALRLTVDAGANASVLPVLSVASLVGFGAVVAALPAFEVVQNWVLSIGGGPLVSLAASVNILAALTGSASGGMTIALGALGDTYLRLAAEHGIDPALMHRVAVIGSGTLDALPHNGAVVTLLSVCGTTHRDSYSTIIMTVIAGPVIALIAVIAVGSALGSF
jgi:H+/gluconate symporter-like permease